MFFRVVFIAVVGLGTDCDHAHSVPNLRIAINTQCDHALLRVYSRLWGLIIVWEVENNLAATPCFC